VLVRVRERSQELGHDARYVVQREPEATLEPVPEFGAGHVLHHDVRRALLLAEFMDGDDVRVGEAPRRLRFALEAHQDVRELARFEHLGAQGLDGDPAADDRVEAFIHDAHGAAPDLYPDFVLAYLFEHAARALP